MRALLRAALALAITLPPLPSFAAGICARPDPVGTGGCPGVRPGARLYSGDETCTFGFVFAGSDKRRYVATAGHCAFASDPARDPGTTQTWKVGTGPVAADANRAPVGRFAYAAMAGQFRDFALVRLDKGVASNPQMCHFGGPVRLTTDVSNDDVQVHQYGQGIGNAPARTGDAFFGLYRADYVYFYGAAYFGDSGGPVTDATGGAVGIVTDLTTPFTGNVGVNRLADNVKAAEKALQIKLSLLTAPTL